MKKLVKILSFTVLASSALSSLALAGVETNGIYLKVLQASNDIPGIIQTIPDVEKLWPQEPEAYLKSVDQAAHVLGGALNNSDAKQAFVNLFTSMMQKSCPTNEGQAISWVELKRDTILYGLNFDEIRNDKSQWINIANFIGEIRSRIIPNYTNQGGALSVSMPDHPEIVKAMVDENERKKITDQLQQTLRSDDVILGHFLLEKCSQFPFSNPANTNFLRQVISAAHLTGEESQKLQRANAN